MIRLTFLLAGTRLCVYNLNLNMKIAADQWQQTRTRTLPLAAQNAVNLRFPPAAEGGGQELTVALAALRCIKNNFSDRIARRGYELPA